MTDNFGARRDMDSLSNAGVVSRLLRLLPALSPQIRLSVDEYGLPIVDYGRRFGIRVGRRRNPTTIAIIGLKATQSASLVGLSEFDRTGGVIGERQSLYSHASVERMARWLLDSSIDRGEYMVYHYDFPNPTYLLRPPWRSCLAEAFGGMFLVVFGTAKKNQRYVDCGLNHLKSMLVPVSKGGVRSDDSKYFLEYVGYDRRRRWPVVLNAHLYCLITLFNAWKMLDIPEFGLAFEQAVSGLDTLLPIFEGRFCTYYDDYGNPALPNYHRTHIHLLERICELTELSCVCVTAQRWRMISQRYNFTLSLLMRAYTMRFPYLPRR